MSLKHRQSPAGTLSDFQQDALPGNISFRNNLVDERSLENRIEAIETIENSKGVIVEHTSNGNLPAYSVVCLLPTNKFDLANKNDPAKMPVFGIIEKAAIINEKADVTVLGTVDNPSWNWNPKANLFVDETGNLTESIPTLGILQKVGWAVTATSIVFKPEPTIKRT